MKMIDLITKTINQLNANANINQYIIKTLSDGWIIIISNIVNKRNMIIYGYDFPINNSCFYQICKDKSSCYEFLNNHDIQSVEHIYYQQNMNIPFEYPFVLKHNNGTCGRNVFFIQNENEFNENVQYLMNSKLQIAISKFYNITDEYRCIVYNREVLVCYKKVPQDNHNQQIFRKCNLCNGNIPIITNNQEITDLAIKTADAFLNYNENIFCSIDIIFTDNVYKVLEINAGVMMNIFSDYYFKTSIQIYSKVIDQYFHSIK